MSVLLLIASKKKARVKTRKTAPKKVRSCVLARQIPSKMVTSVKPAKSSSVLLDERVSS
jgi:hypothetical protein